MARQISWIISLAWLSVRRGFWVTLLSSLCGKTIVLEKKKGGRSGAARRLRYASWCSTGKAWKLFVFIKVARFFLIKWQNSGISISYEKYYFVCRLADDIAMGVRLRRLLSQQYSNRSQSCHVSQQTLCNPKSPSGIIDWTFFNHTSCFSSEK